MLPSFGEKYRDILATNYEVASSGVCTGAWRILPEFWPPTFHTLKYRVLQGRSWYMG